VLDVRISNCPNCSDDAVAGSLQTDKIRRAWELGPHLELAAVVSCNDQSQQKGLGRTNTHSLEILILPCFLAVAALIRFGFLYL
jgi:hypothetical protein